MTRPGGRGARPTFLHISLRNADRRLRRQGRRISVNADDSLAVGVSLPGGAVVAAALLGSFHFP